MALPSPGQVKTIATLSVPGGSYAIFAKAVGSLTVPGFSCAPGTDVIYCNLLHNERRLASTAFGCVIQAGASSDLGRANLIAGANALFALETVGAELLHTFPGGLNNTIRLRCLQYAGGKWPVSITNARLIAMRVERARRAGPLQGTHYQDRPCSEEAQAEAAPPDPEVMPDPAERNSSVASPGKE